VIESGAIAGSEDDDLLADMPRDDVTGTGGARERIERGTGGGSDRMTDRDVDDGGQAGLDRTALAGPRPRTRPAP
jgi:hypothetical protein